MTQYEKMTETSIPKLCTRLAIPTILSSLVTAIYNMADTFFVGKLGNSPSAAIGVVFSLQTLIQALGFTIGMGTGSMISRSLGKKDEKTASTYLSSGIFLGGVLGLIFLILGSLLNEQIMHLLGASETSLPYAISYARWIFIAAPFMMMSFVMNNSIRSEGKARLSMFGIVSGSIINIGLDPLFINVFHMGISGAGLATMVSQMISFSILLCIILFKNTVSRLNFKYISKDYHIYLEAFKCGSPTLFRQGFSTSANIIMNFLAKPYGDALVAALSITNKIYHFVRSTVIGIGQGYQPVLGFNYGAKKYNRIRKAFFFTLAFQTAVSVIAAVITFIFPSQLTAFFRNSEDVIEIGKYSVRFLAISLPFLGFSTIVNQSLQVTGYSYSASFLASCRQGVVYTPLVFLFELTLKKTGLCLTQPVSDFLTAVISIPFCFYFFRILRNKEKEDNTELVNNN